jgi:hypothetical protein
LPDWYEVQKVYRDPFRITALIPKEIIARNQQYSHRKGYITSNVDTVRVIYGEMRSKKRMQKIT